MSYRGITTLLPIGQQGFFGGRNPSQMGPGHLSYVDGMTLEGGVIQKEGGAARLNGSAFGGGPIVIGGINWAPSPNTYHDVVFLDDGRMLRDEGGGTFPDELADDLSSTRSPPPVFVPAGGETVGADRKLFIFSRVNSLRVLIGPTSTSVEVVSNQPSDWGKEPPTFGVLHGNRLWGGGNISDPHRIYYSTLTDHGDFDGDGSGSLPIYPGEGETLVGGVSFRGRLILFKFPTGVYVVDTRSGNTSEWQTDRLSDAVGAVNQQTIIQIENDVMYLDHGGNIHLLSATEALGDVNTSNISQLAELGPFMRRTLNLSNIRHSVGVWYAAKRQAWFAFPQIGEANNSLRMMVDFNQQQEIQQQGQTGPRFLLSRRDISASMWMRPDQNAVRRPAAGDDEGTVWLLDREALNKDGEAYQVRFETAETDLSFADPNIGPTTKNGQFLEVVVEPSGDWNLTVEVWWDDHLTEVLQFSMGSAGAALGNFELNVNELAADVVTSQQQRISGSGRRIRLVGYNDGADEQVSVAEFYLRFSAADERIRHDAT